MQVCSRQLLIQSLFERNVVPMRKKVNPEVISSLQGWLVRTNMPQYSKKKNFKYKTESGRKASAI